MIKSVGYNGNIVFNKNYPDGVKRRQLDSSYRNLGWRPKIKLKDGLIDYCGII